MTFNVYAKSPAEPTGAQASSGEPFPDSLHPEAGSDDEVSSIDLSAALEASADQNETWAITEAQIQQSIAFQREVLAALLPNVQATASGTRIGEEIRFGDRVFRPQYDWSAQVGATLTVFDGSQYPLYSRAEELVDQTRARADWERRTLDLNVERAFYSLWAAEKRAEIARRAVDIREQDVSQAQALVDAALAVPLDVSRAQTRLLEAEQQLYEVLASLGNASDAIAVLMGRGPGEQHYRAEDPWLDDLPPERLPEYVPDLVSRPDIIAASQAVDAVEDNIDAVWLSFLPIVTLGSRVDFGPQTLGNPEGFIWSISLSASWLLYDGGARVARIEQLEAQQEILKLQRQRDLRNARGQAYQALREWWAAVAALRLADEQILVAEDAYQLARLRFEQGLSSNLEVIQAADGLIGAQLSRIEARLRSRLAAAEYRYQTFLEGERIASRNE